MKARGKGVKKRTKTARRQFTPMPQALAPMLLNLQRRRQLMRRSSPWVFASPTGKLWAERNFNRSWEKVRQFAQTKGVRPLPLHCTRHSYISWALAAGTPTKRISEWALAAGTPTKRISEWCEVSVAVLERTYAHVLPQSEPDLSFTAIPAVEENGDEAGTDGDARPRRRSVSNQEIVVTRARFERATPSFGDLRSKSLNQLQIHILTILFKSAWWRLETA